MLFLKLNSEKSNIISIGDHIYPVDRSCPLNRWYIHFIHCFKQPGALVWFAGDELPYFLHHAKIACCDLLLMSCLIFHTMPKLPVVICCWWAALFFTPCQNCLLWFAVDELPYFSHHANIACCDLLVMSCLIFHTMAWCQHCLLWFAGYELPFFYTMPTFPVVCRWWWALSFLHIAYCVLLIWTPLVLHQALPVMFFCHNSFTKFVAKYTKMYKM